ncbi:MAG: hypothetical protein QXM46_02920, partial [Candidatus Hadarchaeales archaeon]
LPEPPGIMVVALLAGTFVMALAVVSITGSLVKRGIMAHRIRGAKAWRVRWWVLAWMAYFVERIRTVGASILSGDISPD